MGFFRTKSGQIDRKMPKRKVEDWKKSDVNKWLAVLQMSKYEESFKTVSGKRVLQLSAADVYRFADNKQDADTLLESIQSLRETGMVAPKVVAEDSANNFLQHSSSSDQSSPTESLSSTPTAAEAETLQGPFPPSASSFPEAELQQSPLLRISNAEGPQQIEQELELQGLPSPQPPRGPEQNARILSSWTGGTQAVAQLFSYLNQLHILGGGLVDATECCPIVGHIVGAIWELHDLAAKAWGHRANCLLLDSFLQDVMRTLDSQGSALAKADSLQLAHLLELIEAAIELVDGCNKSGWLVRMVASNKFLEELTRIHASMLDLTRAMKADTLPNGRQLTYGSYKDCSRPLRRCLKQLGSGSVDGGINAIKSDNKALEEVAAVVMVEKQVVLREAESATPALDLESQSSASDAISPMSPDVSSTKCVTMRGCYILLCKQHMLVVAMYGLCAHAKFGWLDIDSSLSMEYRTECCRHLSCNTLPLLRHAHGMCRSPPPTLNIKLSFKRMTRIRVVLWSLRSYTQFLLIWASWMG